jgi:hypothetical protein
MKCLHITEISCISHAYIAYTLHILRTITISALLSKFQYYFLTGLILNVHVFNIQKVHLFQLNVLPGDFLKI